MELPVLVHAGHQEQSIEPAGLTGAELRPHLQVSQSTMDLEQFCQRRAEALCNENRLTFSHCQDYDVKIQHVSNRRTVTVESRKQSLVSNKIKEKISDTQTGFQ